MHDELEDPIEKDLQTRIEHLRVRRDFLMSQETAVLNVAILRIKKEMGREDEPFGTDPKFDELLTAMAYRDEVDVIEELHEEEERVQERLFKITWQLIRYQKRSPEQKMEIQLRLSRRVNPRGLVQ